MQVESTLCSWQTLKAGTAAQVPTCVPDMESIVLCYEPLQLRQDVVRRLACVQQADPHPVLRTLKQRIDGLHSTSDALGHQPAEVPADMPAKSEVHSNCSHTGCHVAKVESRIDSRSVPV